MNSSARAEWLVPDGATLFGRALDAFDPDLTAFRESGGKLLLYHGWNDPSISPLNTVDYYGQVDAASGGDAEEFARLFMVPGMLHCRGGPGPSQFDMARCDGTVG